MEEKLYEYWFIFIKSSYLEKIPMAVTPLEAPKLFAYTDNKKLLKKFMELHNEDAFKVKKKEITRRELNLMARKFQNYFIREIPITTKTDRGELVSLDVAITESEHMLSESRCYSELDSIWKAVWDGTDVLKRKYREALDILQFNRFFARLESGDLELFPTMDVDILGSLILNYGPILNSEYDDEEDDL